MSGKNISRKRKRKNNHFTCLFKGPDIILLCNHIIKAIRGILINNKINFRPGTSEGGTAAQDAVAGS